MKNELDEKSVMIKIPTNLHKFLKKKAKENNKAFSTYLFEKLCEVHNIEFIPAQVKIPEEEVEVIEEEKTEIPDAEDAVGEEVMEDIETMEKEEQPEEEIETVQGAR